MDASDGLEIPPRIMLQSSSFALTCNTIAMEQRLKYFGKSLDCSFPKVCRGKFLYIVIPATKVVYAIVPNQVANDSRWMFAPALLESLVRGAFVERPAKPRAPKITAERNNGLFQILFGVQFVGSHFGRFGTTGASSDGEDSTKRVLASKAERRAAGTTWRRF